MHIYSLTFLLSFLIDDLADINFIFEELFTIYGDSRHRLDWDQYGFKMDIPQDSLNPTDSCDIRVKVAMSSKFTLPHDTILVSTAYAISFSCKLLNPATVEMQHCVSMDTQTQCDYTSFVVADCTARKGPYVFKYVDGGYFSPGSSYGKIQVSDTFIMLGIVKKAEPR